MSVGWTMQGWKLAVGVIAVVLTLVASILGVGAFVMDRIGALETSTAVLATQVGRLSGDIKEMKTTVDSGIYNNFTRKDWEREEKWIRQAFKNIDDRLDERRRP